jgi:hypothetical protein
MAIQQIFGGFGARRGPKAKRQAIDITYELRVRKSPVLSPVCSAQITLVVRVLLTELAHPISPLLWKKSLSQTQSKNQQALFSWQHMLHVMRLKSGRAFLEEQPSDVPAMARRDVVICPELEHKPTLRRHRGCAAFDPQSGPRIGLPSWMQAVRVVKIAQTSSSD